MFFKNLVLYRFTPPPGFTPEGLAERLEPYAFRSCGGLEPFSQGFESPFGPTGETLVHAAAGRTLLCLRREERLLPPAVVREATEARVAEIEANEFRTVRRKERARVRDELTFELLPRAFTRSVRTFAYLCTQTGWLAVDAAAAARAEEAANLLAQAAPELRIAPYAPDAVPGQLLTGWLRERHPPAGFTLGDECELRDPQHEGGIVRCQRQDLAAEEMRAHLRAHKEVRRLGLVFEEAVTFALTAELELKRLRYLGVEALEEERSDLDPAARFDADFAFMTATLAPLLERILQIFGEAI